MPIYFPCFRSALVYSFLVAIAWRVYCNLASGFMSTVLSWQHQMDLLKYQQFHQPHLHKRSTRNGDFQCFLAISMSSCSRWHRQPLRRMVDSLTLLLGKTYTVLWNHRLALYYWCSTLQWDSCIAVTFILSHHLVLWRNHEQKSYLLRSLNY